MLLRANDTPYIIKTLRSAIRNNKQVQEGFARLKMFSDRESGT